VNYSGTFFDQIQSESLSSARVVVPHVSELIRPTKVVDVGCATGAWLSVFGECGVKTMAGLDGPYVDPSKLLIPPDCFRAVDLMKPFHLSERFDLAMSLEVAEHLPDASAKSFVNSLCRLAPIILFSAAIPGQMGTYHINEQWPEYWRLLFSAEGFRMFDPFRSRLWHDQRVALWYRQNMFLYIEDDFLRHNERLSCLPEIRNESDLILIDANIFFGVRATLKRLPSLVARSFRRRVQQFKSDS